MFHADPYMWFCRGLYFLLGLYLILQCKEACCACCNDSEEQQQQQAVNANNEENANGGQNSIIDSATIIARRREQVRECLEIRKIVSPPSWRTADAAETIGSREEYEEDDGKLQRLEEGKASPSTSTSTTHTRDTVFISASVNDDIDDPTNSSPENHNGRTKGSLRSFLSLLFRPKRKSDGDADESGDDAEDADELVSSIRSDSSFWLQYTLFGNPDNGTSVDPCHNHHREEDCCSICLEPYRVGDTVARLKRTGTTMTATATTTATTDAASDGDGCTTKSCCNHWFHKDCILEWLQNHDDCPLCRVDMIHK